MVVVESHLSGHRKTWCVAGTSVVGEQLLQFLATREGATEDVVLWCGGRVVAPETPVAAQAKVVATLRLPGGKGGFGSMLRAIGAQIEKTTNREACRDLSGRRLRDINEEKRLKDFISKKAEREREMQEKKKQKFTMLNETPKHIFHDDAYFKQRELREKNLYDSLDKAFGEPSGSGSSGQKRPSSASAVETKSAKKGRFLDDLDDSSEGSEEEEEEMQAVAAEDGTSSSSEDSNTPSTSSSAQAKQQTDSAHSSDDSSPVTQQQGQDNRSPAQPGQQNGEVQDGENSPAAKSEVQEEENSPAAKPGDSVHSSSPTQPGQQNGEVQDGENSPAAKPGDSVQSSSPTQPGQQNGEVQDGENSPAAKSEVQEEEGPDKTNK